MSKKYKFDWRWNGVAIPDKHWHFHRQLFARYGIVLEPGEFSEILRDIRKGYALLIERRQGKQAIYSVRLSRRYERIYVLSDGKQLFTAWPPLKRLNDVRRQLSSTRVVLRFRVVDDFDERDDDDQ